MFSQSLLSLDIIEDFLEKIDSGSTDETSEGGKDSKDSGESTSADKQKEKNSEADGKGSKENAEDEKDKDQNAEEDKIKELRERVCKTYSFGIAVFFFNPSAAPWVLGLE